MDGKFLGKINSVRFGFGGYQDAQFGMTLDFRYDKGMGVSDFMGTWAEPPSTGAKWTAQDQTKHWGEMVRKIAGFCSVAGVNDFNALKGKPVEITIENSSLKSWRLLEEVL